MSSSQSDSQIRTGAQAPTRASRSGLLQVSLVAVPVKAYPAVSSSETVRFNQLHADCGERNRQQKQCPVHGPVESAEIVKGYQHVPEQYVRLEDSELNALRPPREKALCLEQFAAAGDLDATRFAGRTLHLAPDGMAARRDYAVLAAAMQKRGCCGVGQVVLAGAGPVGHGVAGQS